MTTRVRVILVASPRDNTPPKIQPDEESLEARWVTLDCAGVLVIQRGGSPVGNQVRVPGDRDQLGRVQHGYDQGYREET